MSTASPTATSSTQQLPEQKQKVEEAPKHHIHTQIFASILSYLVRQITQAAKWIVKDMDESTISAHSSLWFEIYTSSDFAEVRTEMNSFIAFLLILIVLFVVRTYVMFEMHFFASIPSPSWNVITFSSKGAHFILPWLLPAMMLVILVQRCIKMGEMYSVLNTWWTTFQRGKTFDGVSVDTVDTTHEDAAREEHDRVSGSLLWKLSYIIYMLEAPVLIFQHLKRHFMGEKVGGKGATAVTNSIPPKQTPHTHAQSHLTPHEERLIKKLKKKKSQLKHLQEEISVSEDQIRFRDATIGQLEHQVRDLSGLLTEERENSEQLQTQLNALTHKLHQLNTQVEVLTANANSQLRTIEKLESVNTRLSQELDEQRQCMQNKEMELSQLKCDCEIKCVNRLEAQRSEIEKAHYNEIEQYRDGIEKLEEELKTVRLINSAQRKALHKRQQQLLYLKQMRGGGGELREDDQCRTVEEAEHQIASHATSPPMDDNEYERVLFGTGQQYPLAQDVYDDPLEEEVKEGQLRESCGDVEQSD